MAGGDAGRREVEVSGRVLMRAVSCPTTLLYDMHQAVHFIPYLHD